VRSLRKYVVRRSTEVTVEATDEMQAVERAFEVIGDPEWMEDQWKTEVIEVGESKIPYSVLEEMMEFLENLKKLYWNCPGCNRTVAPDEPYAIVNEEIYCMKCVEEGI